MNVVRFRLSIQGLAVPLPPSFFQVLDPLLQAIAHLREMTYSYNSKRSVSFLAYIGENHTLVYYSK